MSTNAPTPGATAPTVGNKRARANYKGERGNMRLARRTLPTGDVQHYEGERGSERLVRLVLTSGVVTHFEGEAGGNRELEKD